MTFQVDPIRDIQAIRHSRCILGWWLVMVAKEESKLAE